MSNPRTILVVDDIPLMRALLIRYVTALRINDEGLRINDEGLRINDEGLRIGDEGDESGSAPLEALQACDGEEALGILRSTPVDLIFLDLMMPVMDGLTFLARKKEEARLRDIPVIVCSARGDPEALERATELGAQAYIVKPFTLQSVERSIREALQNQLAGSLSPGTRSLSDSQS